MIEELIIQNIQGIGIAGSFIAYLIYQRKLDREDQKEERHLRLEEKNQFIKILSEIKEELIKLQK